MRLLAVGLSHHTAPVELRETVDFSRAGLDAALQALASHAACPETVVLSTCNRAEIYAVAESDAAADTLYLAGNYVTMEPGAFAPLHARGGTNGEARWAPYALGRTTVAVVGSTLYT